MHQLAVAVAVAIVIEGVLYALFPDAMKRMMLQVIQQPSSVIRLAGLTAAAFGLALAWTLKGGLIGG